jgi:hypothetical protein
MSKVLGLIARGRARAVIAAAITLAVMVAVAAGFGGKHATLAGPAAGPAVQIDTGTAEVGQPAAVTLNALNIAPPGLGAWTIDIDYDPSLVSVNFCNPDPISSVCNPSFGSMTIRDVGATASGFEGNTKLATIGFQCNAAGVSPLSLSIDVFADATIGNPQDIDAVIQNGAVFCTAAGGPGVVKSPRLANLWLCQPVASCANPSSGVGERDFNVELSGPVTSVSPKGERQSIGSFEFEVRFDRKLVNVTVDAGEIFDRPGASCATIAGQGFVQFRCNIKGKPVDAPTGPGVLAIVHVRPTSDVYSMAIASQENGIATQLINQDCQLSDLQGHPIATALCSDADVTLRYLEGDVDADCVVDVRDQQEIAFRWNSHTGQLLYNSRFDLEPAAPKLGDGDIDAKDLQVIYGRHGSTCGAPHPAQPPVNLKATPVGAPTPTFTPPPTPVSAECPVKAGGGPMAAVGSTSTFTGTASVALCALNIAAPGLGAWTIDIDYDPAVVTVVNCVPFAGSVCNPHFGVVTIRDTGASATGLEGDTLLATIAFQCKAGGKSPLTPSLNVFADATIGNPQNIADATVQAGSVTCKAS